MKFVVNMIVPFLLFQDMIVQLISRKLLLAPNLHFASRQSCIIIKSQPSSAITAQTFINAKAIILKIFLQ